MRDVSNSEPHSSYPQPLSLHRSSAGFGVRMRTPLLVPGVFLLLASFWRLVSPEDCCLTKTVRDASEDSKLNGVYILKAKEDSKPDPNCMDGCVYLKDNEDKEYCFIEKSGASVICEVRNFFCSIYGQLLCVPCKILKCAPSNWISNVPP